MSPQVRVFTYLIGREMTFAENVKWIACNNKGGNQSCAQNLMEAGGMKTVFTFRVLTEKKEGGQSVRRLSDAFPFDAV